ncbi:hypothetical protein EG827_13575 [bacterium]|nr:hypothetical protein [bacterium]
MNHRQPDYKETDLTILIFSVSAALVGVCLTVIGIFLVSRRLSPVRSIGEKLLAVDALIFLASCILSYISLKMRKKRRQHLLEKIAEEVFFLSLIMMSCISLLIVHELV